MQLRSLGRMWKTLGGNWRGWEGNRWGSMKEEDASGDDMVSDSAGDHKQHCASGLEYLTMHSNTFGGCALRIVAIRQIPSAAWCDTTVT